MSMPYLLPFALLGLVFAGGLQAKPEAGRVLHEQNCVACHAQGFGPDGSGIYTRANRRVNTLSSLENQVNFCQNNLGLAWFEEEVGSVVKYLNQQYYRFE
jgi:mono/diheme cytochrome c family protein